MLTIQALELRDGSEYVVIRGDKGVLLFQWDEETGDYRLVLEPVFGSWSIQDIAYEQLTLE